MNDADRAWYENRNRAILVFRAAGDTYAQIGNQFALTRERIRQIVERTPPLPDMDQASAEALAARITPSAVRWRAIHAEQERRGLPVRGGPPESFEPLPSWWSTQHPQGDGRTAT